MYFHLRPQLQRLKAFAQYISESPPPPHGFTVQAVQHAKYALTGIKPEVWL